MFAATTWQQVNSKEICQRWPHHCSRSEEKESNSFWFWTPNLTWLSNFIQSFLSLEIVHINNYFGDRKIIVGDTFQCSPLLLLLLLRQYYKLFVFWSFGIILQILGNLSSESWFMQFHSEFQFEISVFIYSNLEFINSFNLTTSCKFSSMSR